MRQSLVFVAVAMLAGVVCVYAFPPSWLAPIFAIAALVTLSLAVILRMSTKAEQNSNSAAGLLLLLANLPQQPFAEVKTGWVLTGFLTNAAFLVALGMAVMLRAYV